MGTKVRIEAQIDSDVKNKAIEDAKGERRSLSNHIEVLLNDYKAIAPVPKNKVKPTSKKEYDGK